MDEKTYKAIDIAKYIIKKAQDSDNPVTNLKLQKLLYYAQGWYLANFGKALFSDPIEAWKYGPVVPSVYQLYKECGSQPISESITRKDLQDLDQTTKNFLDELWEVYGKYSSGDLINATHSETPWRVARKDLADGDNGNYEITLGQLELSFKEKLQKD